MAQKQTTDSTDAFRNLMTANQQKQVVEEATKKRMKLEEDSEQVMGQYERVTDKILKGEATVEELSKLDEGMKRGQQCTQDIYQIAEGLSVNFEGWEQFVGQLSQYKGREVWFEKLGLHKVAYRTMVGRIKKSDVNENVEQIVSLGHLMVHQTNQAIIKNTECYHRITGAIQKTTDTLSQTQPIYEKWRADRESLQGQVAEVKEKQAHAEGAEFAKLQSELVKIQSNYDAAKFNEDHFFAIVDKARQALKVQPIHQQSYRDAINGLDQIKQRLEADIEHNTPLFLSVKTMIETGLTTKSAGTYNQAQRAALDTTTATVQKMAAGILDEAAKVAESYNLDPEKTSYYRGEAEKERAAFVARLEAVKARYTPKVSAPVEAGN
jgi:hypothetical protein